MGAALLGGLLANGVPASRVLIVESRSSVAKRIAGQYHVAVSSLDEAIRRADVVVLAVKPQDMAPVLAACRSASTSGAKPLIVSIAAGLTLASLARALGRGPLIRVMPNLPAKIGSGVSALAYGRGVSTAHRAMGRAMFGCVGDVVELPERLFDVVTAVSGSGPAYVFYFLRALRDAAVEGGIPKPVAERLALRTVLGSAKLLDALALDADTLIQQVASRRGTTEAALKVFDRRGLARVIRAGVAAAARRSRELSAYLSKS